VAADDEKEPEDAGEPYDPSQSNEEWREAVESWEWQPLDKFTRRKVGSCPRCGHVMTVDAGAGSLTSALPRTARRRILARCNCSGVHNGHPERPNNDWGCGFRTSVTGP
jgi:hypothetical protein